MAALFSIGEWVVDTKRKTAPTVLSVIDGLETVYVLEDDSGELYLAKESSLIKYDKYWFDNN